MSTKPNNQPGNNPPSAPASGSGFRGRGIKLHNDYVRAIPDYSDTPKSVMAAVAYSLARRLTGEDDHNGAVRIMRDEWHALHESGIVPQRPPNTQRSQDGAATSL